VLRIAAVNGEQDQGVLFNTQNDNISGLVVVEEDESPKQPMLSALKREALSNIGKRRRSSGTSNRPSVNLRKGKRVLVICNLHNCSPRILEG
jgi:hypothetical protein